MHQNQTLLGAPIIPVMATEKQISYTEKNLQIVKHFIYLNKTFKKFKLNIK
jgi:hypothetical protein